MSTHDPPIPPISATLSLTRGIKRNDSHPRSDLDAQTSRQARPWPRASKISQAHAFARVASQSRHYAAPDGDISADSDGNSGASAASAGASAALVDSNVTPVTLKPNKKRLRAEDGVESTLPAKRLRGCDDDDRHVEDNLPDSSSSSPCNNMCASSSRLSKWQSPRTSPLGLKSSFYCRRSKMSPQPSRGPSKANPTPSWRCILENFYLDNKSRNPYCQSAQWCQDLHSTGLKDRLHPQYWCPHLSHPCDPGYDEWLDESWSDEEWSDGEDSEETLTPSDEDHEQVEADARAAAAQVRIVTPAEPSQTGSGSSATFTFVHWSSWGTGLPPKPTVFNSPLPWDDVPDSDSASTARTP